MSPATSPPPVKIITDSSVDLPAEIIKANNITVVPLNIAFEGEIYRDGVDIQADQLLNRIKHAKEFPESLPVNEKELHNAFFSFIGEQDILAVFLSGKMGKSFRTAKFTRAKNFKVYSETRRQTKAGKNLFQIELVDSQMVSLPVGLLVLEAAEKIKAGWHLKQIRAHMEAMIPRTRVLLMVDTLENLARGGRISYTLKQIGTLLRFKPILHMSGGLIDMRDRAMGSKKQQKRALELMQEDIKGFRTPPKFLIGHVNAPEKAALLRQLVENRFSPEMVLTAPLGTTTAMHVGPGTVGITYTLPGDTMPA